MISLSGGNAAFITLSSAVKSLIRIQGAGFQRPMCLSTAAFSWAMAFSRVHIGQAMFMRM